MMASTRRTKPRGPKVARVSSRTGGKAGGGGYSYQAQVAAFVATHVLAAQRLGWAGDLRNDFPVVMLSETGQLGDDIGIELADSTFRLDAQVKKSLTGGAKLNKALAPFKQLPDGGSVEGVLVVDSYTSRAILLELREDLRRVRQGRFDDLHPITKRVLKDFTDAGASHATKYLTIVPIWIAERSDPHRGMAISLLAGVFGDSLAAEAVFELLENYCLKQIKDRGRLTKADILAYLKARSFVPVEQGRLSPATLQRSQGDRSISSIATAGALLEEASVPGTPAGADNWNQQIDAAKRQLAAYRPQDSLSRLDATEEQMSAASRLDSGLVPAASWLRLHANMGAALFRLGRVEEATVRFERALEQIPTDASVRANLARALVVEGKNDRAIDEARRSIADDPNEVQAWSVLAELNAVDNAPPPPGVAARAEWITARASALLAGGSTEDAIELLRRALTVDVTPERRFMLAYAIFVADRPLVRAEPTSPRLIEAEALLDEAIKAIGVDGYSAILEEGLLLRASIRRARGDLPGAQDDAFLALRLHPLESSDAWRPTAVLADVQLEQGRWEDALATLRAAPDAVHSPALTILTARAQSLGGDAAAVRVTLLRAIPELTSEDPRVEETEPEAIVTCVEIAVDAGLPDVAGEILLRVRGRDLGWLGLLAAGRVAVAKGELAVSVEYFEAAIRDADAKYRDLIRFELAATLGQLERYDDAVRTYEEGHAWKRGDPFRAPYVFSLLQLGRLQEAFDLLEELRLSAGTPDWALLPAAWLFEVRGDLRNAVTYLNEAIRRRPESVTTLLRLSALHLRLGDHESAARVLGLLLERDNISPRERMFFAGQLFAVGDRTFAVRQAFRALRESRDSGAYPEVRRGYLNLFMQAEQMKAVPKPVAVWPDTRVHFVPARSRNARDAVPREAFAIDILSDQPANESLSEFLASDPVASPAMGKRVGSVLTLEGRRRRRGRFRIAGIESLPGLAYGAALNEVAADGAESDRIRSFPVGVEGTVGHLMPILAEMLRQQRGEDEVVELYAKHGLPLQFVGKLMGRPTIEAYWLIVERGPYLLVEHSDFSRQRAITEAAASESALVFTRSALATLDALQAGGFPALAAIRAVGRKLLIPRSLLDELLAERGQLELGASAGATRMGATASGFSVTEQTPEQVQKQLERFNSLFGWVTANVEIAPVPFVALQLASAERRELIGSSSADAIEICLARHATLFADDRGLSDVALERGVLLHTSTRALVIQLGLGGHLLEAQVRGAVAQLVRLRHYFVPVSAPLLVGLARDEQHQITPRIRVVFERLGDSSLELKMQVDIATACLREVAATGGLAGSVLSSMTQRFLQDLSEHHQYEIVCQALGERVSQLLSLLPNQAAEVANQIGLFRQAKRLSGKLN